jgi:diguanylate cyclase (GGDEF)-like protein
MTILLVSSSVSERKRFIAMFEQYNRGEIPANANVSQFELVEADGAENAFANFRSRHPDLIMISAQDKVIAGKELCVRIRKSEEQRHTGIVFISTSQNDNEMLPVECLEVGADDFIPGQMASREVLARVNVVLRMKSMTDELRSANHRLEILSLTDELTGLANMRLFNMQYVDFLEKCKLGQSGLAVIMMDLDHFKSVNDTANHLVGSHVISSVGKLMKHSQIMGKESCQARYGGDEYVVCMLVPNVEEAYRRAEAFRKMVETAQFEKDGYKFKITCSVGVSFVEPFFDGKSDDPIKAADVMLYRSKEHGRNCVNSMILRYPIDFHHVGRTHLIERDASSDHDSVPTRNNIKISK